MQAPGYWLNYNRYGYALNNPLIYTDPDGEFWHLIIGAAIGGTFNWLANGAEFSWEGLGYFGIGAVSGAVGAGVGTGISASLAGQSFGTGFMMTQASIEMATGFTAGAISGFGGGFVGGFMTEFPNSWLMEGKSFNSSISDGWDIGWKAGFSGAIVGGVMGGIDAAKNDLNFLSGARNQEVKVDINEIGVADIAHREAREDLVTIIDDNNPLIYVQPFENGSSFVTIKTPKGIRFFTKAETIYTNQSIANPSIIKGGLQFTQFQNNTAIRLYGNRFFYQTINKGFKPSYLINHRRVTISNTWWNKIFNHGL